MSNPLEKNNFIHMNKLKHVIGSIAIGMASLITSVAHGQTVESLFPTASVSELATGFLSRYIDLLLSLWPLMIGVAVVFSIVYLLLRKAKKATKGKF